MLRLTISALILLGVSTPALADCANYRPAATLLAGCYEELGETQKLADLKAQWGVDEEEEDKQATAESLPAPAGNDIFETD